MSTLPRLHHEHNASVDPEATRFTASGRPEQITALLKAMCVALSGLPLERMEREAGVLTAEGPVTRYLAEAEACAGTG